MEALREEAVVDAGAKTGLPVPVFPVGGARPGLVLDAIRRRIQRLESATRDVEGDRREKRRQIGDRGMQWRGRSGGDVGKEADARG